MGRLKEFLITERARIGFDCRETENKGYLAWRIQLEAEERDYEEKERIRSDSFKQENKKIDV
tara:strand:- start:350 stop:535 length:186 start_codon:yes stop_codon:yes gene_type:complete